METSCPVCLQSLFLTALRHSAAAFIRGQVMNLEARVPTAGRHVNDVWLCSAPLFTRSETVLDKSTDFAVNDQASCPQLDQNLLVYTNLLKNVTSGGEHVSSGRKHVRQSCSWICAVPCVGLIFCLLMKWDSGDLFTASPLTDFTMRLGDYTQCGHVFPLLNLIKTPASLHSAAHLYGDELRVCIEPNWENKRQEFVSWMRAGGSYCVPPWVPVRTGTSPLI